MKKKKMAKALVLTAALGGLGLGQSFFNEAHATNCDQCVVKGALGITTFSCMSKPGSTCSGNVNSAITVSCNNSQKC